MSQDITPVYIKNEKIRPPPSSDPPAAKQESSEARDQGSSPASSRDCWLDAFLEHAHEVDRQVYEEFVETFRHVRDKLCDELRQKYCQLRDEVREKYRPLHEKLLEQYRQLFEQRTDMTREELRDMFFGLLEEDFQLKPKDLGLVAHLGLRKVEEKARELREIDQNKATTDI